MMDTMEYEYDGNRRLVSTTDPRQHEVNLEYDNMGNVRAKQDGEGNRITYKYDILGRLEQTYNDNSTTTPITSYTYYIDGTLKEQIIDVYTTTYYYNSLGKLKEVCAPNGIGVPSKTEEYEYTATGWLKKKKDREGNNTTYEYDCHGRMISQLAGDSSTYVQITVPNELTDMGYDGNGNLKKIIVETKENGVLKSRVTTQRNYDELNRVKTKTETSVDENSNTVVMGPVTYNYDITTGLNAGEVKEQGIYPGSNSVDKVYDAAGRLKTVTSDGETTQYEYYDDGRRDSVTYNNNFRQEYTYYDDGLLDTLTNEVKDSQGVFVESEYYKYDYDGAHNMTQKQERLKRGAIKTTTYDYDCMNRLENIYKPDGTIAYTFDLRGNRDTEIETDTATNEVTYTKYQYTDDNRLQFVTKREDNQSGNIIQRKYYAYDNNGNLTNAYDVTSGLSTITTNTYTLLNQLKTSITAGINEQMENTYNAEGRRVAKTVGGTTARYLYEYDDVAFEYTNSGTISAFNVIGTNLISRETGSDKVYYFCNGHGDVTALLDATTNIIRSQYKYDEFGNITTETYYDSTGVETIDENEIIKSQILYAGYQYDKESKYYNLQSRYYDPQIARFLQQDTYTGTIDDPLSLNLYTYCHNEPVMYVDPTGYSEKSALDLIDEIIAAKKIYEDEQKLRDKMLFFIPNKYKRTEAQKGAVESANTARSSLKDTEAYKNPSLQAAIDSYLAESEKNYGGTMDDVLELRSAIIGYNQLINEQNHIANSKSTSAKPNATKGTGNSGTVYANASADGSPSITSAKVEANARYIYDYFTKLGWSKEAICALLGNMEWESGINPGRWEDSNPKTADSNGYGLVQWTSASGKFLAWSGLTHNDADKMAINDPKQLMDKQLQFLLITLNLAGSKEEKRAYGGKWFSTQASQSRLNTEYSYGQLKGLSGNKLNSVSLNDFITNNSHISSGDMALMFEAEYERSGDTIYNKNGSLNKSGINALNNRIAYANKWYNFLSK